MQDQEHEKAEPLADIVAAHKAMLEKDAALAAVVEEQKQLSKRMRQLQEEEQQLKVRAVAAKSEASEAKAEYLRVLQSEISSLNTNG